MIVAPRLSLLEQLDAIKVALLDGGSLRLYQNDYTPSVNSVVGDFTIADFSGYANKTIATWNDVFLDPLGRAVVLAPMETWTRGAGAVDNIIYGAYYLDVGGALVWGGRFAEPVNVAGEGSTVNMVPKYLFGPLGS